MLNEEMMENGTNDAISIIGPMNNILPYGKNILINAKLYIDHPECYEPIWIGDLDTTNYKALDALVKMINHPIKIHDQFGYQIGVFRN